MAAFVKSVLHSLRASASDAWRYARANRSGLAALATLIILVFAVLRRRFKLGAVLFHVAVALGEKWQEARARRRVGALLTARPVDDASGVPPVAESATSTAATPPVPASPPNHA